MALRWDNGILSAIFVLGVLGSSSFTLLSLQLVTDDSVQILFGKIADYSMDILLF